MIKYWCLPVSSMWVRLEKWRLMLLKRSSNEKKKCWNKYLAVSAVCCAIELKKSLKTVIWRRKNLNLLPLLFWKVKRLVFTNFDTKFTSFDEDTFYLWRNCKEMIHHEWRRHREKNRVTNQNETDPYLKTNYVLIHTFYRTDLLLILKLLPTFIFPSLLKILNDHYYWMIRTFKGCFFICMMH